MPCGEGTEIIFCFGVVWVLLLLFVVGDAQYAGSLSCSCAAQFPHNDMCLSLGDNYCKGMFHKRCSVLFRGLYPLSRTVHCSELKCAVELKQSTFYVPSAHSNASATPNPITVDHEARLRELQENAYQSVLVCFLQEEFDLVSNFITLLGNS